MSLNELSPEELCDAYRAELRRLYGDERAEASRVDYGRGWYYIGIAKRFWDGSMGLAGVLPAAYRKKQIIEMIHGLRIRRLK